MRDPVRVALIDESPTMLAVLGRIAAGVPGLEVVARERALPTAWPALEHSRPSVVILGSDGDAVELQQWAEEIEARIGASLVVLSSRSESEDPGGWGPGIGAVLAKPRVPSGWEPLRTELPELILGLAGTGHRQRRTNGDAAPVAVPRPEVVVVGASTGGPVALHHMLTSFGDAARRVAILVVQHIAPGFEQGLAEWFARDLSLGVDLAQDGAPIEPGRLLIAPPGCHLLVSSSSRIRLDADRPPVAGHRPSVNLLFESAARILQQRVAAVLLSGMGRDGADGMAAIRAHGGATFAQDRTTCAVYGMPRAAAERGLVDHLLSPEAIGQSLARAVSRGEG